MELKTSFHCCVDCTCLPVTKVSLMANSVRKQWILSRARERVELPAYLLKLFKVSGVARMVNNDWKTSSEAWVLCIQHHGFIHPFSGYTFCTLVHIKKAQVNKCKHVECVCVNSGKEGRNWVSKTRAKSVYSLQLAQAAFPDRTKTTLTYHAFWNCITKLCLGTHQYRNMILGNQNRSRYARLDSAAKRKKWGLRKENWHLYTY